jgi:hypothetical protein
MTMLSFIPSLVGSAATIDSPSPNPMTTLSFIASLVWPIVTLFALWMFRADIGSALGRIVKFKLFDVEIVVTRDYLESVLRDHWAFFAPGKSGLDNQHWDLLERLEKSPNGSLARKPENLYNVVRPLRNAGLIATEPPDVIIEESETISFTPLGRLLVKARRRSSFSEAIEHSAA